MNEVIWKWLVGSLIIFCVGCLLHFVYQWSGRKKWVAVFAAVNESTWEHIKIALTPTFIFLIIEAILQGFSLNFLVAAAAAALVIVLTIPILFYGYQIFTKRAILVVDIVVFLITVMVSQWVFWWLMSVGVGWPVEMWWLSAIILLVILIWYFWFSFWPPKMFLFKDPIDGEYGIESRSAHSHHHKKRGKRREKRK